MFQFSGAITDAWNAVQGPAREAFQKFSADFGVDALKAAEDEWPKVATGQEKWDAALGNLTTKVEAAGWKDAGDFCNTLLQSAYQSVALQKGKVPTPPTPL